MTVQAYCPPEAPGKPVKVESPWLGDEVYVEVLKKTIVVCTDAVLRLDGEPRVVYLARRRALPMAGPWIIGGRMLMNDATPEESVARCVLSETGLAIEPERFRYLCTNLYSWVKVAQGDFPGRNLGMTYVVTLSQEELHAAARNLYAKEYDREFGLQPYNRSRMERESVYDALIDIFNHLSW